jgi:diaminopropionate ammonia-lyase family
MLFANPHARRRGYDAALKSILNIERGRESRRWLSHWNMLSPGPTPLRVLPGLARRLGIGQLSLKDESLRSPLGSFKALGAPIALLRLIRRRWPAQAFEPEDLLAGRHAQALKDFVVISATDGNHGRALAAAARSVGCRCVIVLHAAVSAEREMPIAELGAEIVRVAGNYDASVEEAARLAQTHGWQVVSDTSYEGYEEIPRDVMQGYGILVDELLYPAPNGAVCPFTHVAMQGDVGGLAAGVVSHFWERYGAARPGFIVVEPEQADCLLQSARNGRASRATCTVDSLIDAAQAMRTLAHGEAGDVPVVSGESGAAGLAALVSLMADAKQARQLGLDAARACCC